MFVNSYVCKYPKSVKAAISINGLPRYGFSCVPDEPVNFISYASLKDKTIPPIGKISYDGLFMRHNLNLLKIGGMHLIVKIKRSHYLNIMKNLKKKLLNAMRI